MNADQPSWNHNQEINFKNVIPGLEMIKSTVEKVIEAQKNELENLKSRLSQFNR